MTTPAAAASPLGTQIVNRFEKANHVLRVLWRLVISLAVVVLASFLMVQMIPGDPVRAALGPTAPLELVAARRAALGLDLPLWDQLVAYINGLFTGDLGTSMVRGTPVAQIISDRIPTTMSLALISFAVALLVSIPVGLLLASATAGGRRPRLEAGFTITASLLGAIPEFLIAVFLVTIFSVGFGLFPVAGLDSPSAFVLPVIALSIGPIVILTRLMRIESIRAFGEDYVKAARAKHLSTPRIFFRHVLPNSATASLTFGGIQLAGLVLGTVFIESVFALPGLGATIVIAIGEKDYPLIQGIVLVYGAAVLVINAVVDLVLVAIDPRAGTTEVAK